MRPLSETMIGVNGIAVNFYNGTSVVSGYIVRQSGTNSFMVTDGTVAPKKVKLAPTATIANDLADNTGYCSITIDPPDPTGTGATFTPHYKVDTATKVAGGTGYTANDSLTVTGGGGAKIIVDTVNGSGVIQTAHADVAHLGDVTSLPSNPVAVTGGSGSGATFNLNYKLLSVATSGGTGYKAGDPLVFNGITAATPPTAHVTGVSSGAPTGVTVDTAGSGISVAATSISAEEVTTVQRIWSKRLRTSDGLTLKWTLGASVNGSVLVPTFS